MGWVMLHSPILAQLRVSPFTPTPTTPYVYPSTSIRKQSIRYAPLPPHSSSDSCTNPSSPLPTT